MQATSLTAGTYSCQIKDANLCIATNTVTVVEPTQILVSISSNPASCNGEATGSATAAASGGIFPYSYNWIALGNTNPSVFGLSAGFYYCQVTDANLCIADNFATISEPLAIATTNTTTPDYCGGSNGTLTIAANGGTGNLQYSIDGGATYSSTNTFSLLPSGNYPIAVRDANNCVATNVAFVPLNAPPVINTINKTDESCFGASNGSINISASGLFGPFQYSIDGGLNFVASNSFTNLAPFFYNVVVQDANGCIASSTVTINSAIPIDVSTTANNNLLSANEPSATYQWIDCNTGLAIAGETNQNYTATANGNYAVIVSQGICSDTSACIAVTIIGGISVTYQVDMTPYIAAGGIIPVNTSNIKIAGNFTDLGATIPNWTPLSSPVATNISGNIYSITVSYPTASIGMGQQYKFLATLDTWGSCNTLAGNTQECLTVGATCTDGTNDNRFLIIPAIDSTVCFDWNTCNVCGGVGIKKNSADAYALSISPNPSFNGITKISYSLASNENVSVKVYNVLGSEVIALVNENQATGAHSINWNNSAVNKGVYFVTIKTGSFEKTVRVVVM